MLGLSSHNGNKRTVSALATLAVGALFVTSCAGGVGEADAGVGFEYGADQEEVDAAIADLDPVTITLQAGSPSPNAHWAKAPERLAEKVEERSKGKITVDVVYGQPIASLVDADEALADGRIDVAFVAPAYDQASYPAYQDMLAVQSGQPSSPIVGETAHVAQSLDLAWGTDQIISEMEDQGLIPLVPATSLGSFFLTCTSPAEGLNDWNGRMTRASGIYIESVINALGSNPVTMDLTEVYEALQRNAIDCTSSQPLTGVDAGTMEVAPYISIPVEGAALGARAGGALMGGSNFANLPLAYQQIVFDSTEDYLEGSLEMIIEANLEAFEIAKARGGTVTLLDDETNEVLAQHNDSYRPELMASSVLGAEFEDVMVEKGTYWQDRMEELGYTDDGSYDELDSWYEIGTVDFGPAANAMFEEIVLPHRPQ